MRRFSPWILTTASLALAMSGCTPAPEIQFATPEEFKALPEELQKPAGEQLEKLTGTYASPRLPSGESAADAHLKLGQAVYQLRCAQCHGDNGDGNGPVGAQMYPRPRDYRKGIFKFTSTSYGAKPLRSDLVRTLRRGIRGTSMPAFDLLPADELEAVVDYILVLTHRGELTETIAYVADTEGELSDEVVKEGALTPVLEKWATARESVILPLTPEPELTAERAARGRELFMKETVGCVKCHGPDGRGRTKDNLAGTSRTNGGIPRARLT